jgi:hypothetical protein
MDFQACQVKSDSRSDCSRRAESLLVGSSQLTHFRRRRGRRSIHVIVSRKTTLSISGLPTRTQRNGGSPARPQCAYFLIPWLEAVRAMGPQSAALQPRGSNAARADADHRGPSPSRTEGAQATLCSTTARGFPSFFRRHRLVKKTGARAIERKKSRRADQRSFSFDKESHARSNGNGKDDAFIYFNNAMCPRRHLRRFSAIKDPRPTIIAIRRLL